MNATQIRAELATLTQRASRYQGEVAHWDAELRRALAVEPKFFNQADVEEARAQKSAAERRVNSVDERIAALKSALPSEEQVATAKADATNLAGDVSSAATLLRAAWPDLIALLEEATEVAQQIDEERRRGRSAAARVNDLVSHYALDAITLPTVQPESAEAKYASLLITLLSQTVVGEASEKVIMELRSLRATTNAGKVAS